LIYFIIIIWVGKKKEKQLRMVNFLIISCKDRYR